jgi:hypothetical protein
VDLAVEIVPKESNPERARAINERRVLELELLGRRFRGFLDREFLVLGDAPLSQGRESRDLSGESESRGRDRARRAVTDRVCGGSLEAERASADRCRPSPPSGIR